MTERLTGESDWRAYYPVVREFWPVDGESECVAALREMTDRGYAAFGLRDGEPVSFAGGYVLHAPWYGEFLWLVDLVTRPDARGEGYGSRLYGDVEAWAAGEGCETVVLASGVERERTHRFYRDRGFEVTEYWFEKSLTADGG